MDTQARIDNLACNLRAVELGIQRTRKDLWTHALELERIDKLLERAAELTQRTMQDLAPALERYEHDQRAAG